VIAPVVTGLDDGIGLDDGSLVAAGLSASHLSKPWL